MKKNEIQQIFGMVKFILILAACIIFVGSGYILIENTDWHTLYVILLIMLIGVLLGAIVLGSLKILLKIEDWVESREKVPKEVQESKEVVNIAKEPKKKLKLPKILKIKRPKTEYLGTPPDEVENAIENTVNESVKETTEKLLPIEKG